MKNCQNLQGIIILPQKGWTQTFVLLNNDFFVTLQNTSSKKIAKMPPPQKMFKTDNHLLRKFDGGTVFDFTESAHLANLV